MASRKEEKEQRRREREERERQEEAAAARRKRLALAGGGLGAIAVIAVVGLALGGVFGGDGDTREPGDEVAGARAPEEGEPIPAREEFDLEAAAAAANCTVTTHEDEGNEHVTEQVEYDSNPPTSGPHNPQPAADGVYDPGGPAAAENLVHTLEHGRVIFQYRPGTPPERISQLETLAAEDLDGFAGGYHVVLTENTTGMDAAVAATAWTQSITCPRFSEAVFDALRAFRAAYTDRGPEFVP